MKNNYIIYSIYKFGRHDGFQLVVDVLFRVGSGIAESYAELFFFAAFRTYIARHNDERIRKIDRLSLGVG